MPCLPKVEIITAGVPCQDVSVAGKRRGLSGERTGLFYQFARILKELRPTWFVFENVPGLLSSNRGRDFAEVLRVLMVECGYGVSWRVLDSRFFGVAQRRRRLFIVGRFGKPCPAEVLFEPEGGDGDSAAGGEAGSSVAYAIAAGSGGSKFGSGRQAQDPFVVAPIRPSPYADHGDERHNLVVAETVTKSYAKGADHAGRHGTGRINLIVTVEGVDLQNQEVRRDPQRVPELAASLSAASHDKSHAAGRRREDDFNLVDGIGIRKGGPSYTLSETERHAVAFNIVGSGQQGKNHAYKTQQTGAIQHKGNSASGNEAGTIICTPTDTDRVREATELPEGLDSARYRALGNAVTVSVAEWIARRIMAVRKRSQNRRL